MERTLTSCLLLWAVAAAFSSPPYMRWSDEEIDVMSLFSLDYYNKISREDAVYTLLGNNSQYVSADHSHQLHFTIKETECRKPQVTTYCNIKEDGVEKFCTSTFYVEDDHDSIVLTCEDQPQELKRGKRSRGSDRRGRRRSSIRSGRGGSSISGGRGGSSISGGREGSSISGGRGGSSIRGGRGGSSIRGGRGGFRPGLGSSIAGVPIHSGTRIKIA